MLPQCPGKVPAFSIFCVAAIRGGGLDKEIERYVVSASRKSKRLYVRSVVIGVGLFAVAALAGTYWLRLGTDGPRAATRPTPIPVSAAPAARRDVPIYVSGLGTVQALNTVPVHSQVDGKLIEISFTEGQHVKKGDVLAKIDPRLFQAALDQAVAKKGQDQAQLIAAQKDLERFNTLVAKRFDTQQNVDQQQAKVDGFKASIAADQAAIESAQTQLDYTAIVAPIDGRVGIRQVDLGSIIHANDPIPLVMLTQTQPASVIFTLPQAMLDDLRDAMARGPVEVTAYDQNNVRALGTGKILLIDDVIDQATSTIKLKALFPNTDERLWPGEFVNARVLVETRHDALTIPASALQRGPQGLFTWVIIDDKAQMRPIKVGPPTEEVTIVTAGLEAGESVVTEGQYKLQPDAPVTVTASKSAAATAAATMPARANVQR